MFNCLKFLWNWFIGKNNAQQLEKLKEAIPEEPIPKEPPKVPEPPPPIKKGSLADIRDFCDEMRKDLRIRKRLDELHKKNDDRLYVEVGNLRDKIKRFIEGQR